MVGKPAPDILRSMFKKQKPELPHTDEELLALATKKNGFYLDLMPTQLKIYDGVNECLDWAKTNSIKLCVVSNARRRELRAALESLKIDHFFDEILSREELAKPKPDPMAYLTGAAVLQVNPSECYAIEDSPTGLESALLGGVPCIGLETNFSFDQLNSPIPGKSHLKPNAIYKNFRDFFESLRLTDGK